VIYTAMPSEHMRVGRAGINAAVQSGKQRKQQSDEHVTNRQ
jgi:hypothetical protein